MMFVAACVTVLQVVIIITRSPMANWAMMSASARATTLLAMVIIIRRAMAASVTALNSAISSSVRAARLAALRLRCLIRTLQWRRATGAAFQICLFMPVSGPCKSFMLLTLVVRLPPACHTPGCERRPACFSQLDINGFRLMVSDHCCAECHYTNGQYHSRACDLRTGRRRRNNEGMLSGADVFIDDGGDDESPRPPGPPVIRPDATPLVAL